MSAATPIPSAKGSAAEFFHIGSFTAPPAEAPLTNVGATTKIWPVTPVPWWLASVILLAFASNILSLVIFMFDFRSALREAEWKPSEHGTKIVAFQFAVFPMTEAAALLNLFGLIAVSASALLVLIRFTLGKSADAFFVLAMCFLFDNLLFYLLKRWQYSAAREIAGGLEVDESVAGTAWWFYATCACLNGGLAATASLQIRLWKRRASNITTGLKIASAIAALLIAVSVPTAISAHSMVTGSVLRAVGLVLVTAVVIATYVPWNSKGDDAEDKRRLLVVDDSTENN